MGSQRCLLWTEPTPIKYDDLAEQHTSERGQQEDGMTNENDCTPECMEAHAGGESDKDGVAAKLSQERQHLAEEALPLPMRKSTKRLLKEIRCVARFPVRSVSCRNEQRPFSQGAVAQMRH